MRRLSAILPAILPAALLVTPACKPKPSTNVSLAPDDGSEDPGRGAALDNGPAIPRGPIDKIQLHGSASGIGDMLAAGTKLVTSWMPPEPGSPAIDLRTLVSMTLIQQGFGPGFFDSLRLDDVHAFEFAYPRDGQPGTTEADIELALALSASDPVRAIESLPAAMQPQPLGNNLWQMPVDNLQVYLRASADAIEMALAMDQLARASGLRQKVPPGPRLRLGASNIPAGDIDVGELLPIPGSEVLTSVLNDTTAVEFTGDFGSDRDFSVQLTASAPFGRLGLDPIGPATQAPSELAALLPGDAMLAWSMPWGNPKLLHGLLDRNVPVNQIPAPFDGYIGDVLRGTHGMLDVIETEVLAAAYLDSKMQLTMVLAAEVKDEAAARAAMRGIMQTAEKAFGDHLAMVGSSAEHKYKVAFKADAVKVGKAKADSFVLTLSKSAADDPELGALDSLVGRKAPKLEILMVVSDGKLIVTIGLGGRAILANVGRALGKPQTDSLEAEAGLAQARKLTDGCQYCVAIDPLEVMRMVLTVQSDDPDNGESMRKRAREASATLAKLGDTGQVSLALRMSDDQGSFGLLVPKDLLFLDAAKVAKIRAVFEAMDDVPADAPASTTRTNPR